MWFLLSVRCYAARAILPAPIDQDLVPASESLLALEESLVASFPAEWLFILFPLDCDYVSMLRSRHMQDTHIGLGPVVTVLNLKGGVGKTHTVWLLASVSQERSLRILAVDLDTDGNLSS